MKQFIYFFCSLFFFSSCYTDDKKEFDFDHNEPRFISSFKTGDTIYFESAENDVDTIVILEVGSAQGGQTFGLMAGAPTGKSCWVRIKHLPVDKWHGVTINGNTNDTTSIDFQELVYMQKDLTEHKTIFTFSFKNFHNEYPQTVDSLHMNTIKLNQKIVTEYFLLKDDSPGKKDSSEISSIYFNAEEGLFAYKNFRGNCWVKKKNNQRNP